MHSSRMRTGRALTLSRGGVCSQGDGGCTCLVPGGCLPGGVCWGVYLPGPRGEGCTCLVPGGCLLQGGVPAWSGGVYLPGPRGVYLPGPGGSYLPGLGGVPAWSRGGCTCLVWGGWCTCLIPGGVPGQVLPPVNRMTDRCKNITLAKTSFRPVIIKAILGQLC